MRWQYGKVTRVYAGKELLDVRLDTGEVMTAAPTYDVEAVC